MILTHYLSFAILSAAPKSLEGIVVGTSDGETMSTRVESKETKIPLHGIDRHRGISSKANILPQPLERRLRQSPPC